MRHSPPGRNSTSSGGRGGGHPLTRLQNMTSEGRLDRASALCSVSDSGRAALLTVSPLEKLVMPGGSASVAPSRERQSQAVYEHGGWWNTRNLDKGDIVRSCSVDLSGDCTRPFIVSQVKREALVGRGVDKDGDAVLFSKPGDPTEIIRAVRCRKCRACLRAIRNMWIRRAEKEFLFAQRTWFVTLTFSPEMQVRFWAKAGAKSRFELAFDEVQKMFKRMRAGNASEGIPPRDFRYLVVMEHHKTGDPHFHMLLHEKPGCVPIGNRDLSGNEFENITPTWWKTPEGTPMGWVHCRLIRVGQVPDGKSKPLTARVAAMYVCKYITKNPEARIRASIYYDNGGVKRGGTPPPPFNPH